MKYTSKMNQIAQFALMTVLINENSEESSDRLHNVTSLSKVTESGSVEISLSTVFCLK